MTTPRILVAGIGNIFLGDDAFGVEVAQRLIQRPIPDGVRIIDFGIRGLDLAYCLLDGYSTVILIDAVPRGDKPGTLYVIEPDISSPQETEDDDMIDAHSMHPEKVLRAAAVMGAKLGRIVLVGCEPAPLDSEIDIQMQLSQPVRAAVDEAVRMIDLMLKKIIQDARPLVGISAASHEQGCRQEVAL